MVVDVCGNRATEGRALMEMMDWAARVLMEERPYCSPHTEGRKGLEISQHSRTAHGLSAGR